MIKHHHFIGYSEGPAANQHGHGMASPGQPFGNEQSTEMHQGYAKTQRERDGVDPQTKGSEAPVNVPFNHFYIMEVDTFEAFHFE